MNSKKIFIFSFFLVFTFHLSPFTFHALPFTFHVSRSTHHLYAAESAPASVPASSVYSKGDKIEVLWHGAWYKAVVEQVSKNDLYKVSFYGYWHDRDEYVPPARMRPTPARKYPNPSDLKEGDHVEFLDDDHWRPAVFVEMVGSKAKVRYADHEKQREEVLPLYKLWKSPP